MNCNLRAQFITLAYLMLLFMMGCKKDPPKEIPTLTTTSIRSITSTTATGGGLITNDGGAAVTARGVCWSLNQNPTISDTKTSDGSGIGRFTSYITGLAPGATYYLRAYSINNVGTGYGDQVSISTPAVLPTITTIAVSNITDASVTSGGAIKYDGGSPITARGVCWNTMANPTINNNKTNDGAGSNNYVSNITGLSPGTTYYIRAYAINSLDIAYGNEIMFTTLATIPSLITNPLSSITSTTALCGGDITSDGGSNVTARGVCWSTSVNPTIYNNKTVNGIGVGLFISNITGLANNTTYNVRAYATNSLGTAYGNIISFTTKNNDITFNPNLNYGKMSDIDGNEYKTIMIGTQNWMAENLRTTKFSDGSYIQNVGDISTWDNASSPAYCWYNNIISNKNTYGALYNWYCLTSNKLCPEGWHIPTDREWNILTYFLGGASAADHKLKETGNIHWKNSNSGWGYTIKEATNESGFTALPGGVRFMGGPFDGINDYGMWWSIGLNNQNTSWFRIGSTGYYESRNYFLRNNGYSIRCIATSVPTLTTNGVSIVMYKNAFTGGNITDDGGAPITERGVCWSTKQNPSISDNKISSGSGIGFYSCTIPDLVPGTKYYVKAYATNKIGTGYGNQISFDTEPVPSLSTIEPTNITSISAKSGGVIISSGGSQILSRGICWSINENPTTADKTSVTFNTSSNYTCDLTNLISGTKYFIRAFATSLIGTGYGNQVTFTTLADVPKINTKVITNITSSTAMSGGVISHDGGAPIISRGVCWNTKQNPKIEDNKTADGSGTGDFSSSINGLMPNTEYFVRAYATNSNGTGYGKDERFTTLKTIPILTTAKISGITSTTAISGGDLISNGGSFIFERGICWSTSSNPTIADKKSVDWGTNNSYNCNMTGLIPDTKYNVRSYAINLLGTGYGNLETFITDVNPIVSTPVISPAGGTYSGYQTVTITCGTSGAEIRYTKDGSVPINTSSLYTSAIQVNNSMTIKARAFKSNWTESSVATQTYIIDNSGSVIIGTSDKIQHISKTGDFVFRLNNLSNKDVYFVFSNKNTKSNNALPRITGNITPINTIEKTTIITDSEYRVSGVPSISEFNNNPRKYPSTGMPKEEYSKFLMTKSKIYSLGSSEEFIDYDGAKHLSTIRKIISAHGKNLYIWVANDCWGSSSKKSYYVTQVMIDAYAPKFLNAGINDDIYEWVTNICGPNWGVTNNNDLIPNTNDIHIWLTDIENPDYAGYFSGVNNHLKSYNSLSNEKLMFVVDAVYFATPTGGTWELTDKDPMFAVSTLAHEFLHMIYFYQKIIKQNLSDVNNAVNEMAAQCIEDLVANKILADGPRGVAFGTSNAGSSGNDKGRLPLFNKNNNLNLLDWPNDERIHYSKTYAFGAYLMRNYGGANLIKQIVQNQYTGVNCVVNAVNNNGGVGLTIENILKNFGAANLFSDNTSMTIGYKYNTGTWSTSSINSIIYQLGSINLYNYSNKPFIHYTLPTSQAPCSNIYYLAGSNLTGTKEWIITGLNSDIKITVIIK